MDKEKYKRAFSVLHASGHITWENIQKNAESFERREGKVNEMREKNRKIFGMRPLAAAVCGCMLLALIGGSSVYALKPVYGLFSKVFQISDHTRETADRMGRTIGDSVTSDGVTVTAEGILRDAHHYAVVLSVARQDGKKFTDKADGKELTFGFRDLEDGTKASWGESFSYDENSDDSAIQIAYLQSYTEKIPETLDIRLTDFVSFNILESVEEKTIAKGTWKFHLSLPSEESSVLIAKDKTVNMKSAGGEAEIVLNEIWVSPIGFSFTVSRKEDDKISLQKFERVVENGEWKLELKDGTFVDFYGGTAVTEKKDGRDYWVSAGTFDKRIIPANEMKSIHINNIEIPVP